MESILIVLIVFAAIVSTVKIIADSRLRNRLIDKGLVDEKVKFLYRKDDKTLVLSNLKWGMVLVGVGVAAMVGQFFPYYFSEEGLLGLMLTFAGFGFLIYYFIASGQLSNGNGKTPPQA